MYKTYKTELDPNNKQVAHMEMLCEARKFIYNMGAREWERRYKRDMKGRSAYSLCSDFTKAKKTIYKNKFDWAKVPFAVQNEAFTALGDAYKHFFRKIKNKKKDAGKPALKRYSNSFSLRSTKVERNRVRLTHIGWVRLKEHDYIPADAKYGTYATVSRCAGRWFISVFVKEELEPLENYNCDVLGIDLGIKAMAVCSNRKVFENPKALDKYQVKKKRIEKELARRQKGSNNWKKTKRKLQKIHYKIACVRKHHQHEVSSYVTEKVRPRVIVIEDLNVKGMVKNRHLARGVSDVGMGELRRQIEYKAERLGIKVVYADRFYPSSKKCSECGEKKDTLRLDERTYVCARCGTVLDRDLNAALNLAALGYEEPINSRELLVELRSSKAAP